jgi:glycosyltransferase involved in cell wall biosynthesis
MTDYNRAISVCALIPYPPDTTPSQRFRIEQWMPHLKAKGVAVDLFPFADKELMGMLHKPGHLATKAAANINRFLRRFGDAVKSRRYDAVLIHRSACIAGPATIERLVNWLGRPIIYDFDDAIFKLHTTEANRHFGWLKFPGKTRTICRLSNHVVVGNTYLADYARKYNSRVTVIPTSIDTTQYQQAIKNRTNRRIVIGWTGSSTSQTHLEMFAPVVHKLVSLRDVEFRVISDREPVLPGIPYVWQPWSPETEVEDLSRLDIGIMPIPDDEWARGKCALKALQYMAIGVPTICSPVGANSEVIQHGENGLLASSTDEWVSCFQMLVDDAELRRRLGLMGRRTVEDRYSMKRCAELFVNVVYQTVEEYRSSKRIWRTRLTPDTKPAARVAESAGDDGEVGVI